MQFNGKTMMNSDCDIDVFVGGDDAGIGEQDEGRRNKMEKGRKTEKWKKEFKRRKKRISRKQPLQLTDDQVSQTQT